MAPISKLPFLNIITDVLLMQVPVRGKHSLLNLPLRARSDISATDLQATGTQPPPLTLAPNPALPAQDVPQDVVYLPLAFFSQV